MKQLLSVALVILLLPLAACPDESKLDSLLVQLQRDYLAHVADAGPGDEFVFHHAPVSMADDKVAVDVIAISNAQALARELEALGAIRVVHAGKTVSCYFPIARLEQLNDVRGLRYVRAAIQETR